MPGAAAVAVPDTPDALAAPDVPDALGSLAAPAASADVVVVPAPGEATSPGAEAATAVAVASDGASGAPSADQVAPAQQGRGKGRSKDRKKNPNAPSDGRRPDRIFLPHAKDAIPIRPSSAEMFVLQHLRDEAHRFAVTFHRQRRKSLTLRSVLSDIPGIGPQRQRLLLRHFGSLRKIRDATREDLASVSGMTAKAADAVYTALGGGVAATATASGDGTANPPAGREDTTTSARPGVPSAGPGARGRSRRPTRRWASPATRGPRTRCSRAPSPSWPTICLPTRRTRLPTRTATTSATRAADNKCLSKSTPLFIVQMTRRASP